MFSVIGLLLGVLTVEANFPIETVRESAPGICPPYGTSPRQLNRIVAEYAALHSEAAADKNKLAIKALRQAWPCRRTT
jgi:hypothetical protein